MPQVTVSQTVSGVGSAVSASRTLQNSKSQDISESIPDASVDLPIPGFSLDVSANTFLFMLATGGDITVETNDGAAPDDTIALVNGIPKIYQGDGSNFITTDVTTGLFVTNASGAAVTLRVISLSDATP